MRRILLAVTAVLTLCYGVAFSQSSQSQMSSTGQNKSEMGRSISQMARNMSNMSEMGRSISEMARNMSSELNNTANATMNNTTY